MPNPPIHEIGSFTDANGHQVTVGTDCDGVTVSFMPRHPRFKVMVLDETQRDLFVRLFFEAECQAGEWHAEHAGTGGDPPS